MPRAMSSGIHRVDQHSRATGGLLGRRATTGDDGRALGHRLEHRQAVPLALARVAEHLGARVQRAEVVGGHEPDEPDVAAGR